MARPYSNRPYRTMAGVAEYIGGFTGKNPAKSARKWVERNAVPKKWRGKGWVVHPDDIDRVLNGERMTA